MHYLRLNLVYISSVWPCYMSFLFCVSDELTTSDIKFDMVLPGYVLILTALFIVWPNPLCISPINIYARWRIYVLASCAFTDLGNGYSAPSHCLNLFWFTFNYTPIRIKIQQYPFTKMSLKELSAKRNPCLSDFNVQTMLLALSCSDTDFLLSTSTKK